MIRHRRPNRLRTNAQDAPNLHLSATAGGKLLFLVGALSLLALPWDSPASAQQRTMANNASRAASPSNRALPSVIPTNQGAFGIPIEVHRNRNEIAEFQLWISVDQGKSWSNYQTRNPGDKEFYFEAKQDGLYWFAIRTFDRNNQPRPVKVEDPELIVAIDTRKPELRLDVVVTQSGSLLTRWDAKDIGIVPESFRLQYRQPGGLLRRGGEWHSIATSPGKLIRSGELGGEHNWWPDIDADTIEIQAEISDAANNVTVVTRKVNVPKVARQLDPETPKGPQLQKQDPIQRRRLASGDRSGLPWPTEEADRKAAEEYSGAINPRRVTSDNSHRSAHDRLSTGDTTTQRVVATTDPNSDGFEKRPTSDPLENSGQSRELLAERDTTSGRQGSLNLPPSTDVQTRTNASSQFQLASNQRLVNGSPAADDSEEQGGYRADQSGVDAEGPRPPLNFQPGFLPNDLRRGNDTNSASSGYAPSTVDSNSSKNELDLNYGQPPADQPPPTKPSTSLVTEPLERETLPPGEYALLTNRRQFRLTYEIDAVRPESVDEVELWVTRDGGNEWEWMASDPDQESPFPVVVEEEGIYGFKVVVHSTEGFSGQAPRSGDLADIWVEVDTTDPRVELKSAPLGKGPDAGKLVIHWEAHDHKLAHRPISLFYSDSLEGPWHVIAAGLENTGIYAWKVTSETPKMLFLRIEVEDRAGNESSHDLITPVDLRRLNPTGRIKGFDASGDEAPREARMLPPFRKIR